MEHSPLQKPHPLLALLLAGLCGVSIARAADPFGSVQATVEFDSNVYTDDTQEADAVTQPNATLGVDFADIWTAGYEGGAGIYALHPDLFYHQHEAYITARPTWGENDIHEFTAELSARTQNNAEEYATLNLLEPALFLRLMMEPRPWVRLKLEEELFYRWFYNDNETSSLDSWTRASVTFTAPSRTTITPKFAFGNRTYFNWGPAADRQIEAGIHLSQGVADGVGLRAGWTYHYAFDDSTIVEKSMGIPSFNYMGEEFLFTGHSALLGAKAVFDFGLSIDVSAVYATKAYGGWSVLDAEGNPTGKERTDTELSPMGRLRYTYLPRKDASRAVPEVVISLSYNFLRQWSTDAWYDTRRHIAGLEIEAFW